MKHSEEEIINALAIIQDTCEEHDCSKCPFGTNDAICLIKRDSPIEWLLNAPVNCTWKAIIE